MASWGPVGTEDQEPEMVQADSSLHPTLRRIPTSLHWPTEWSYAMARVGQEKDRHSELWPRAVTPVPAPRPGWEHGSSKSRAGERTRSFPQRPNKPAARLQSRAKSCDPHQGSDPKPCERGSVDPTAKPVKPEGTEPN